ncbi:tetratricopeptide repeat protein [Chroococcidiopsis sp. CCMEE 29]|uniref:tetratricopeptide repeat protein n=1 Tax=Chroococcidiopsis sp. CCMEE 29 TaxID=155894 RepID=UPI002021A13A|nr:tetratricopeptide repeat protein [Chroococcidiopsis sp. CCMEE 29]
MSQPSSRWLIKIVLVLAAVGFVGVSMIPLLSTAIRESQPSTVATPAISQTPMAEQRSQLEGEARGYEVVLQREPENQTALQGLVQVRIQLGDLQGAIAPLEKLIAFYPNQTEYRLVLGQIYATQKNYEAALKTYEQAIEADQQDFRPLLAKAIILKQQGKTEQAKPVFKNAAALAPDQYKEKINQLATEQPAATNTPSPAPQEKQGKQGKDEG